MSKVVVVYHSGYGHTQRVAEHVGEGAGAELLAIDAEGNLPEGGWDKLNAADAIIFGTRLCSTLARATGSLCNGLYGIFTVRGFVRFLTIQLLKNQ